MAAAAAARINLTGGRGFHGGEVTHALGNIRDTNGGSAPQPMQPLRGRCVRLLAFMLTDINFTSVTSLVAAVMQPRRQKIATFIYPNCIRPRRNFAKMFATGKLE